MIDWMERENGAYEVLQAMNKEEKAKYLDELRRPKSWELEVKAQPNRKSASLGKIIITANSTRGLTASFLSIGSSKATDFTPDLFDADWGYGPYFHQTVLQQRKSWFQLPKNPLPEPGWIDIQGLGDVPNLISVTHGYIYRLDAESVVVVGSDSETVSLRLEQSGDYGCAAPPIPPIEPAEIRRIPYKDLFTKDAHLRLKVKYTRGC